MTKIQRRKLSHGGLTAPDKQTEETTAVGSGDLLGHMVISSNLVFHFFEICSQRLYCVWRRRFFNNAFNFYGSCKSVSWACALAFIVLPCFTQPPGAGLANKWLNGENSRAQSINEARMNRSGIAVGVIAGINGGFHLANDEDKSILSVSLPLPKSEADTSTSGNAAANDRADNRSEDCDAHNGWLFGVQCIAFGIGLFIPCFVFLYWHDIKMWWRRLCGLTMKAEPPATKDMNKTKSYRTTKRAAAGWLRRLVRRLAAMKC